MSRRALQLLAAVRRPPNERRVRAHSPWISGGCHATGFFQKNGISISHFSEKTPLRGTPQISRGNVLERGVRLGAYVRPLEAAGPFGRWQIPP